MTIGQGEATSSSSSRGSCLHRRWSDSSSNGSDCSSSSNLSAKEEDDDHEELKHQLLQESSTFSTAFSTSSSSGNNNNNNSKMTPDMQHQQQQQSSSVGFFTRLRLRKAHVPPNMPSQQELLLRHSSKDVKQSNNANNNSSSNVNWGSMSIVILAWYLIGVVAICTTKMLLTDFNVPPLILTVQQLFTGSMLLRTVLVLRGDGGARPWPVVHYHHDKNNSQNGTAVEDVETANNNCNKPEAAASSSSSSSNKTGFGSWMMQTIRWYILETTVPIDFILAGLFNALDFLASNTAFSGSSASFVETIKASEPITTTAVALLWNIDHLKLRTEGASLGILVTGVLLTTVGNKEGGDGEEEEAIVSLLEFNRELDDSIYSSSSASSFMSFVTLNPATTAALTVMTANLCYAFRALSQKRFRAWEKQQQQQEQEEENDHAHHSQQDGSIDDINLLMRMQQLGAMSLIIPAILSYGGGGSSNGGLLIDIMTAPTSVQLHYLTYAIVNTVAYVTYNLASTYVLTSLSVLQHSSLNCLRRMFCTVATSIFFGITWSATEALGVVLCFCGFLSFTHFRGQRSTNTTTTSSSTTTTTTSLSASTAPPVLLSPTSGCDNTIQIYQHNSNNNSVGCEACSGLNISK